MPHTDYPAYGLRSAVRQYGYAQTRTLLRMPMRPSPQYII
jgi:hypothetical protein